MKPIPLKGHSRPLSAVKYNSDGDLVFTCAKDQKTNVWFSSSGERLGSYNGHDGACTSLDVTTDSKYLLTGAADLTARIWNVQSGTELTRLDHLSPVRFVEYAQGDQLILTVQDNSFNQDAAFNIWSLATDDWANQIKSPLRKVVGEVKLNVAHWGRLNETVVTGDIDGAVRVYNSETGAELAVIADHSKQVNAIVFSSDYSMFLTCSEDQTARLYDTTSFRLLKTLNSDRPLNACAFGTGDKFVVLGGGQNASDVTNTAARSGKFEALFYNIVYEELLGSVRGHFGPINSLDVAPDGTGFVTGAEDGYIRLHHYDAEMNQILSKQ